MKSAVSRREARIAAMRVVFAAIGGEETAAVALARLREIDVGDDGGPRAAAALADDLTETLARAFDFWRGDIEKRVEAARGEPASFLTSVERAIISCGIGEALACPQTSPGVIVNEAVEMAKVFGVDGGAGLVHSVLDRAIREARSGDA